MAITQYADPVTVHLRGLPVPLAAKAREHSADLLREFALITADVIDSGTPATAHEVPLRLMDHVVTLTQQLAQLLEAAAERLERAIADGTATIEDHQLQWPQEVAAATRAVADLWDEADRYCWTRDDLIDLVTPPDCAAYRRWFFAQVLDQLEGRRPVPWPQSAAARGL